jgi:hypothetical protein
MSPEVTPLPVETLPEISISPRVVTRIDCEPRSVTSSVCTRPLISMRPVSLLT